MNLTKYSLMIKNVKTSQMILKSLKVENPGKEGG